MTIETAQAPFLIKDKEGFYRRVFKMEEKKSLTIIASILFYPSYLVLGYFTEWYIPLLIVIMVCGMLLYNEARSMK